MSTDAVLRVRNLSVGFRIPGGSMQAVDAISFDLRHGETLGLVGESGSGKTLTSLALLRLLESPPPNSPPITSPSRGAICKACRKPKWRTCAAPACR